MNRAMSQSNSRATRAQIVCETQFSSSLQPARAVLPHSGATVVSSSPRKAVLHANRWSTSYGGLQLFCSRQSRQYLSGPGADVPDKFAYGLTG